MKLQKFLLFGLALGSIKNIDASVLTNLLDTTNRSLYTAANSLASTLKVPYTGLQPAGYQVSAGFSEQGLGTIQTTITNYTTTTVYLIVRNIKNQQINSTIKLTGRSFTYLPPDAAMIELVDKNEKTLVGSTTVISNTPYSITDIDNAWAITKLDTTTTFSYKNQTNIPLVVKITTNNMETKEQINPSNSFSQTINPSTALARKIFMENGGDLKLKYSSLVSIEVHANISPLAMMFEPDASYQINIDSTTNQLSCTQTGTSGNVIVNKTGWPMFINITSDNDDLKDVTLEDGNSYQPNTSAEHILIIPIIKNQRSEVLPAKSFTIVNNKGVLTF